MYNKDMEEKKYIMWSDGVLTSFGVAYGEPTVDGLQKVINPVSIHFQVVNETVRDADGNPQYDEYGQELKRGGLKWDMSPYVFGACLSQDTRINNIWTVKPNYILSGDVEFDDQLTNHYETLVKLCGGLFPTTETAPDTDTTTPEGGAEVSGQ